jgi:HK97 family phage portal protein
VQILDRLRNSFAALTVPETKASAAQAVSVAFRVGVAQWSPPEYRKLVQFYRTNPVVNACVRLIGESVAEIEPYVMLGEQEDESTANPVNALFKRPNPAEDRCTFVTRAVGFRRLHGNAFFEMVTIGATPREIYALRPDLMQIIPGADGWPAVYRYEANGRRKDWRAEIQLGRSDILHLKMFSPMDDIWGQGCLHPASMDLDLHNAARTFQKAILDNGGAPSGALKYNPPAVNGSPARPMSEESFQRMRQQVSQSVSGAKNAGKPLILDSNVDWVQFGLTMVDMQAKETKDDAARMIALAFGVPPMLLGIPGDNTYSNYQEAVRAFFRQTVIPEARLIYGQLGHWIGERAGLRNLSVKIDDDSVYALQDEITAKWTRLTGQGVPLTLNEVRIALGYDKIAPEVGDRIYRSNFDVPLDATVRTQEATVEQQDQAAIQAQLNTQVMLANPGYDPARDADGDGASAEGTGTETRTRQ